MKFDLSELLNFVFNALAAFGAVATFYFALKGDVRSVKEGQDRLGQDFAQFKNKIENAGYMTKADVDRLLNDANETHRRHERAIEKLQDDVEELSKRRR